MLRILLFAVVAFSLCGVASAKDFYLYYLGGQSNMDGFGKVSELPEDLRSPIEGVYIFHGNQGIDGQKPDGKGKWSVLQPGHGREFKSDGVTNQYSDCFGSELTFARRLRELHPDRNIAILKYSRGGTCIDPKAPAAERFGCWDPDWQGGEGEGKDINQYDHFLSAWQQAKADTDIDDDGEADRLIPVGIVWMQGESDSVTVPIAKRYEENLSELMETIRNDLGGNDLRIVIGRITDWEVWTHGEIVRQAQKAFVDKDGNAALVTSTDKYGASDKWHYDTAGYIDLGKEFADAMEGNGKAP